MAEAASMKHLDSFGGLPQADADAMKKLWKEMQKLESAGVNVAGDQTTTAIGGFTWVIVSPTDPDVVQIGTFAVGERNKEAGTKLQFVQVVSGLKLHILAFDLHSLVIRTKDGNNTRVNGALIFKGFNCTKLLFWI